jgi:nicotinamidase-related amidase
MKMPPITGAGPGRRRYRRATNRGVETSVREAFDLDLASTVVRECCWSSDATAHAYTLDKAMKMYARIRRLDQVAAMLRG